MPQAVECNGLHIVRADVIAPCNPRVGAGTAIQRDGRPRASPVFKPAGQLTVVVVWFARADDQLDDVFLYGRRHMNVQHRFSRRKNISLRDGALGSTVSATGFTARQAQNGLLCRCIRVGHADVHEKSIQLCFREGVSALLLDRVLGRHHQKQRRQFVGLTANAHLTFGHGL